MTVAREENPVATVQAWQEAANVQDKGRQLELSDPDNEIVGPRGSGYGHELLEAWLGRAGLILETTRTFRPGATPSFWRSTASGSAASA